ncbi:RMD1 family protein [Bacillus subtilis]|nr:RMD1 family protein [Bacillus subtilis]
MNIGQLTFGTPEYVEATKLAEREGQTDEIIDKIETLTEELFRGGRYNIGTTEQRGRVARITQLLSELI